MISLILATGMVDHPEFHQNMAVAAPLTEKEKALVGFYERHGCPAPVEMARATAKRKRPRLLAAVAVVESGGDPAAVGKVGEVTAWQIRREIWGDTGETVEEHAQKAEEILEGLLKENRGRLRQTLSAYNGDRSGRYAVRVMAKIGEVPI